MRQDYRTHVHELRAWLLAFIAENSEDGAVRIHVTQPRLTWRSKPKKVTLAFTLDEGHVAIEKLGTVEAA